MAEKIFNVLLVLYPVTNIYGVGVQGISLGKLLLLISGFYLLCSRKTSLSFPKRYGAFAIWVFVVPFFYVFSSWTDINGILYKSIGLLIFVLIVGFSCRFIIKEYCIKYFRRLALTFTVFFYLQYFVNLFTGIKILGIIPGLPLADATSIDSYVAMQSMLTRYCSVFLEPSHFAVYISMYLALKIKLLEGKIWNKEVIFIFIALLLLQSGNGYICIMAIGFGYILVNWRRILFDVKSLITVLFCVCALLFIFQSASSSETFSETFNRMEEISSEGDQNSSGFTRIFRGFYYFSDLSLLEKCVGIGQGNEDAYAKTHSLLSFRNLETYTDAVYLNGIQQILVYGGFIGCILFLFFLCQYYRSKDTILLVLPFTCLFFISGVYNSSIMLLYIVFLEMIRRNGLNNLVFRYKR